MLTQQTLEYYKQMETSIGDKLRICPHIQGLKVLDGGCGSGSLMKVIQDDDSLPRDGNNMILL